MSEHTPASESAVYDALPYIETNDDYEQYALALIDDEMKDTKVPSMVMPDLKHIHFRTPLMKHEYEVRTSRSGEVEPVVLVRGAELTRPKGKDDLQSWQNAVQRARIAYEEERLRALNLEVDKEMAVPTWKRYNELLEHIHRQHHELRKHQHAGVDDLNLQRSTSQQQQGQVLQRLTAQYDKLIQKRCQLQLAIVELEAEVSAMEGAPHS